MTVQLDLCRTCSETALLVFPRGGSFGSLNFLKKANFERVALVVFRIPLRKLAHTRDFFAEFHYENLPIQEVFWLLEMKNSVEKNIYNIFAQNIDDTVLTSTHSFGSKIRELGKPE